MYGPNFFETFLNNVQNVMFNNNPFNELKLTSAGSGGLVKLGFTPVPLPTTLPLIYGWLISVIWHA
jgi:hypothetical protein